MSIVAHKYTPGQISDQELEKTFAARWHTLDFLVESLRRQTGAQTLSSFIVTGPRGSGKSTLLRMLRLRIRREAELSGAWLPVSFPEEQFDVASLRDFFAGALKILAQNDVPAAKEWLDKVEQETNNEQSEELSVAGLRDISRHEGKRLILFVENLDRLLGEALRPRMKGTLRRLLMTDPFMILIGSAVHVFDSLRRYDEAFFNYFQPVPLERLTEDEVLEMLRRRAQFDENAPFNDKLGRNEAKIREIAYLSGGNPRFVLMFYELLSESKVTTAIQQLRRLVDELTPLFKHELESLPEQQRKIVHALMEKGGTASPKDLTGPSRLSMNSVSTQLSRLKEAQILEVRGGGKGRQAFYTVPDRLFSIWYKMRYLRQERRRIELFVEVLEVWFDAEERHQLLQSLVSMVDADKKRPLREAADAAEYFAASLAKTKYGESACDLMIRSWLNCGDVREAAKAFAAWQKVEPAGDKQILSALADWLHDHENPAGSAMVLREAATASDDQHIKLRYAIALVASEDWQSALLEFNELLRRKAEESSISATALFGRAGCNAQLGNQQAALSDLATVMESPEAPKSLLSLALRMRIIVRTEKADYQGVLADCTTIIETAEMPKDGIAMALVYRARTKSRLGDFEGALTDCNTVIALAATTRPLLRDAFFVRALARQNTADHQGALADCTAIIKMTDAPKDRIAEALWYHARSNQKLGDFHGTLADLTSIIEMSEAPKDVITMALVDRAACKGTLGDYQGVLADCDAVIEMREAPKEQIAIALGNRAMSKFCLKDFQGALADCSAVVETPEASRDTIARALALRGAINFDLGKSRAGLEDWKAVLAIPESVGFLPKGAISMLVFAFLTEGNEKRATEVIELFLTDLTKLEGAERARSLVNFLSDLARPGMEQSGWLFAWKRLTANQPAEVLERLDVLKPVAAYLEKKSDLILDALPPEQREFIERVLEKFKPAPKT